MFFSVDVCSKKNDLLDALVQLNLDQKVLDNMEKAISSIPQVQYDTQLRLVYGDRNAVSRALNNLKVWNIPQDEIDALHAEAKKIAADKNEAKVTVNIRPNVPPGVYTLVFRGQAQFPYSKDPKGKQKQNVTVVMPSPPLTLTVEKK